MPHVFPFPASLLFLFVLRHLHFFRLVLCYLQHFLNLLLPYFLFFFQSFNLHSCVQITCYVKVANEAIVILGLTHPAVTAALLSRNKI